MVSVVIIGAGPYGLSIAAHLRQLKVPYRIFGKPLDTWVSHMPKGMDLKSDGFASSLFDLEGEGDLEKYCKLHSIDYHPTDIPVSLELFDAYAKYFQSKFVPDLEARNVVSLEYSNNGYTLKIDDGEALRAKFVVLAVGITNFASLPPQLQQLPKPLISHSFDHSELSQFSGKDVTVIGGGSSAVDIATLLHETGARTTLLHRKTAIRFSGKAQPGSRGPWARIRHPSSGLGPGLRSWICENFPGNFRYLPAPLRQEIVRRHLGPSSAWHMKPRFEAGVKTMLGKEIVTADALDGKVKLGLRDREGNSLTLMTDHVVAATGYAADLRRLGFMSPDLIAAIHTCAGMPSLSRRFEASVPGLYIAGPLAQDSFGPLMRFMVGAKYASPLIARHLAAKLAKSPAKVLVEQSK